MASKTAPSSARKLATQQRRVAEGNPPSKRGRPRREDVSASLYVASVRLSKTERELAASIAKRHGLSLAEWMRKAITDDRVIAEPKLVETPSGVDADYARQVAAIGNNLNQVTRGVNLLLKDKSDDLLIGSLLRMVDSTRALTDRLTGADKGVAGRTISAIKLVIGKR